MRIRADASTGTAYEADERRRDNQEPMVNVCGWSYWSSDPHGPGWRAAVDMPVGTHLGIMWMRTDPEDVGVVDDKGFCAGMWDSARRVEAMGGAPRDRRDYWMGTASLSVSFAARSIQQVEDPQRVVGSEQRAQDGKQETALRRARRDSAALFPHWATILASAMHEAEHSDASRQVAGSYLRVRARGAGARRPDPPRWWSVPCGLQCPAGCARRCAP